MSILTVWTNSDHSVKLAQLSDDPSDGTASDQLAHLATLDAYAGYSCVDPDFTGSVPAGDVSQWRWSDGQIVSTSAVPSSVTPRQVRLVLLAQGLLESVETLIASQDEATQITWKYASEFRRDDPLLNQLAVNLNLTAEQLDEFFIAAASL
jgi:hypothetical protein